MPLLEFRRVLDRKSTRLNSSHGSISYAVFCLKKKKFNVWRCPRAAGHHCLPARYKPPRPPSLRAAPVRRLAERPRKRPGACCFFFFFNDTATTEIYTLSLHDALPILSQHIARQRALAPIGALVAFVQ